MALQKKSFNDIITFTRSSDATRYNASGLIELVPANTPRFDYDPVTKMARGLLIEETRTNLRTSSHMRDWSNSWSGTVFPGNVMAPDGSMDGLTVANTPGAGSFINKAFTAPEGIYTHSVFVKPLEGQPFTLVMSEMKGAGNISFNAVAKTFSGGAPRDKGFQEYSNGWIRVWVVTESAAQTSTTLYIGAYGATNNPNLGAVWGYQVELGAFPTSYIPTLDAQVTRTADSVRVNTISPWYNPNEGTLFVEASVSSPVAGVFNSMVGMREASSSDTAQISITRNGVSNRVTGFVRSAAGATQVDINALTDLIAQVSSKVALAYKQDSFSLSKDGAAAITDDMGLVPNSMARLVIGATNVMTSILNGHVRAIRYYPRRLTNAELQALTS